MMVILTFAPDPGRSENAVEEQEDCRRPVEERELQQDGHARNATASVKRLGITRRSRRFVQER